MVRSGGRIKSSKRANAPRCHPTGAKSALRGALTGFEGADLTSIEYYQRLRASQTSTKIGYQ
jgi:hypothetical protein